MNWNKLNIQYPKHTAKIGRFLIPIDIHIKDVTTNYDNVIKEGIVGDIYYDEFGSEYEFLQEKENFRKYLKFINIRDEMFDYGTKTFLQWMNMKSIEEIFDCLDRIDLIQLSSHIQEKINIVIDEFRTNLASMLELDKVLPSSGEYHGKQDMPNDLIKYLNYPIDYILAQAGIEFQTTPFFPENIGRAISEWSFREIEYRLSFLTIKNKKESAKSNFQMNKMDENTPKGR